MDDAKRDLARQHAADIDRALEAQEEQIDRAIAMSAGMAGRKRVAELEGAELDAWVVRALGAYRGPYQMVKDGRPEKDCLIFPDGVPFRATTGDIYPSERWSDGGPIIERERIAVATHGGDGDEAWRALHMRTMLTGPTPLIAAMRTFVASKFGETVPEVAP